MGVGMNTGFPIAFIFSHSENCISYKTLLDKCSSITNIKFKGCVLESDQNKSLIGLAQECKFDHIFCLRHFLHNLQNMNFHIKQNC